MIIFFQNTHRLIDCRTSKIFHCFAQLCTSAYIHYYLYLLLLTESFHLVAYSRIPPIIIGALPCGYFVPIFHKHKCLSYYVPRSFSFLTFPVVRSSLKYDLFPLFRALGAFSGLTLLPKVPLNGTLLHRFAFARLIYDVLINSFDNVYLKTINI